MSRAQSILLAVVLLSLGMAGGWMLARTMVAPADSGRPAGESNALLEIPLSEESRRDGQKATMPNVRTFVLPLNNPDVVPAQEAGHMMDNDIVVGLVVGSYARAYPWWIMANYHVVNDTIHEFAGDQIGTPVFVAMCERCSGAAAFYPVVEQFPDRPLIFQISGVGRGTFEISDAQTLSTWHPFTGHASEGTLKGTRLTRIPVVLERWKNWKAAHPDTDVVNASYQMRLRDHGRVGGTVGHPNRIRVADGPRALNLLDDRLPTNEMVYGLLGAGHESGIAIPLRELEQRSLLELTFEDVDVVLFLLGEYRALGFERRLQGEVLSFQLHSKQPFQLRDQRGTIWSEWGQAIDGPKKGSRLTPASGYVTEWYEFATVVASPEIYADKFEVKRQRADGELADDAESLLNQGLLFKTSKNWDQAADFLQRAIEAQPDLVLAHYNLGFVRSFQGNAPEAIEDFQRTLELQPNFADAHRRLARLLFLTNDKQGALEHYDRAIEIDPDFADAHFGLGVILLLAGKHSEAIAALERAIEIEPMNVEMIAALGDALERAGQLERASEHCQLALRIEPENIHGHATLGRIELKLGNLPTAVSHLRAALEQNGQLVETAVLLARTIATSENRSLGDAAEAVKWAERATKLTQAQKPFVLDTLAAAYAHAGDYEKAVKAAQAAIGLVGSSSEDELRLAIEGRVRLYEMKQPYREKRQQ